MKRLRACLTALTLLALPGLGFSPGLSAADVDTEALYKNAVKSCVFIVVPVKGGIAMGSGSLLDAEKKIVLTNFHVVDDNDLAFVQFPIYLKDGSIMTDKQKYLANVPAGKAIKAKVLYRDKSRDLALIQLDKVPLGTPAIKLSKTGVGVAAPTWNIGSPGAVEQVFSITEGRVRTVGIEKFMVGGGGSVFEVKAKFVTTTNPSNQGDSGGPLIDKNGEQVAVTQSGDPKAQLVNKFVDVSEVWAFLKEKKIEIKSQGQPDSTAKVDPKLETPIKKDPGSPMVTIVPKKEPGASAGDERDAAQLLRRSKLFANGDDNRPIYIGKLKDIIKKYPDTTAAKDAKKILDGLN